MEEIVAEYQQKIEELQKEVDARENWLNEDPVRRLMGYCTFAEDLKRKIKHYQSLMKAVPRK